jgi:hypothetical protein
MQELQALQADFTRIQSQTTSQNPMAVLQSQLNKMTLNAPAPSATLSTSNTFTCVPTALNQQNQQPTYSRQQATAQQPFIITEEMKAAVRQLINMLPHHPDTGAGQAAYAAQLAQWNVKWGESTRVTQETGYPLKPGTAAIASSECFACRTHGHNGQNCPLPVNHAECLTQKEAAWRAIASRTLGAYNRAAATPISLVINNSYEEPRGWIEEEIEQQGKVDVSA